MFFLMISYITIGQCKFKETKYKEPAKINEQKEDKELYTNTKGSTHVPIFIGSMSELVLQFADSTSQ